MLCISQGAAGSTALGLSSAPSGDLWVRRTSQGLQTAPLAPRSVLVPDVPTEGKLGVSGRPVSSSWWRWPVLEVEGQEDHPLASSPPPVNHTPRTWAPKASPRPSPGCPPGRQHSPPCTALSYPCPLSPACLSRTHTMCTALSELSTKGQHPHSFWQDGCLRTSPGVVAKAPWQRSGGSPAFLGPPLPWQSPDTHQVQMCGLNV